MPDRTTETQERGQYDRVGIIQLAKERRDKETEKGRDADPSKDPERDLFNEDYEELADSWNYKTWNMRRQAGRRYLLLKLSRWLIELSYELTLMAEEVSGNNIKRGR